MPDSIRLSAASVATLKSAGLTEAQLKAVSVAFQPKRLALSTPLTQMGFDKADVAKLPTAVQRLNKEDLMALGRWNGTGRLTPAAAAISVQDVQVIRDVLGKGIGGLGANPAAIDINCCCCPCCCATAVIQKTETRKSRSLVIQ
ncbi:hypothetical protein [Spirosoma sp.]|uniref:hypothetical protein n=1 Tax=Spirosoma sp. TaxID=1899569 RepID=UPI002623F08D|nr:hypothetical protein [Spirosoma sp.]MCX6217968.1 hypothetical protein [Spirosoma sp.]